MRDKLVEDEFKEAEEVGRGDWAEVACEARRGESKWEGNEESEERTIELENAPFAQPAVEFCVAGLYAVADGLVCDGLSA